MKFLFIFIMALYSSALLAEEVPETQITLSTDEYNVMVGQSDVEYPVPVTLPVSPSLLIGANEASLQVKWADQCTPIKGSTGLNIHAKGFKNLNEQYDSLEITTSALSFTTKIWLNLALDGQSVSTQQQYECDVIGTEYWPVTINEVPISKLILSIQMVKPTCSISTRSQITLPSLSKSNPTSSAVLPVSVSCEGYNFSPKVFLTLESGQVNDNSSLYEDTNILFEMLYGDDNSTLSGQRWKADGSTKYDVGEVDTLQIVSPLIRASMKDGAKPGTYNATATITLDVE